jgi:rSAM/selenodomain-associated transferase 1
MIVVSASKALGYTNNSLLVFARPPVAGQVKTRLAKSIGHEAALQVYRSLFAVTVKTAAASAADDIFIYVAGTTNHPWVRSLAQQYGATLARQRGSDLGERMYNALAEQLEAEKQSVLIGTDCPVLTADYIDRTFAMLASGSNVVIGPAEDGGYVLVGANQVRREWFSNIDWGTDRVFRQTREQIRKSGGSLAVMETLWDVDRHEDLLRWQSQAVQQ